MAKKFDIPSSAGLGLCLQEDLRFKTICDVQMRMK